MKQTIPLENVKVTDSEVLAAQTNTIHYLMQLDPKRFLYGFDQVAGLKPEAKAPYGGWERLTGHNFRGHFFGHYLSALSQAMTSEIEEETRNQLRSKLAIGIQGLSEAQAAYAKNHPQSAGYVSAFREVALDEVEGKPVPESQKENVIVPWYDLHKILAGLIEASEDLKRIDPDLSRQALQVATNFGTYVYRRVSRLTDPKKMLAVEYGGMNDALYHLFSITQDEHHLVAATYFDEVELFQELANANDVLPGKHANTTIPKLLGAIRRYEIFSDPQMANQYLNNEAQQRLPMYLMAAKNFWQIVIDHHSYVTGGNSQSEHFHDPDQLYHDAVIEDGATTCETCNTHNMLKLSRELFRVTGDKKYLDYYDRTYTNAILGSQNPQTGMMTYFQPMAAGYRKVFNRPFDEFWCCTGTGIESFTKLGDSYYFKDGQTLYVTGYYSNQLRLPAENLKVALRVDRKTGKVQLSTSQLTSGRPSEPITIKFRHPDWSHRRLIIDENGQQSSSESAGFVEVTRVVPGNSIQFQLSMTLDVSETRDNPRFLSLKYGPYVLAGQLDHSDMRNDRPNGILVRISTLDQLAPTTLTAHMDWQSWLRQLSDRYQLVTDDDHYLFKISLPGIDEKIQFVPYYQIYDCRYGIYFQWQQAGSLAAKQQQKKLAAVKAYQSRIVDQLTNFDQNNWEFNKHLKAENSKIGYASGRRFRQADPAGHFYYVFDMEKAQPGMELTLIFNQRDDGQLINLQVGDDPHSLVKKQITVASAQAKSIDQNGFFEWHFKLPEQLYQGTTSLAVRFSSVHEESARVFGILFLNEH
ncbi:beta-L-arabinofuranosidase domain-containing protein [Lentilactobacillus raoultii]|uniref:Beta-L-arabinofuranosidase domain-containing protein n=1 Tax=Lentilactobacillus raoultii TaxID=1987503 RepID=A0ABW3PJ34_9LACO|nr:beta-L-arabinofuranosidase domain-containing protein [Lentilactobacillus raoultii]